MAVVWALLCLLLNSCKGGEPECLRQRSVIRVVFGRIAKHAEEEMQEVDGRHARLQACRRGTCYKNIEANLWKDWESLVQLLYFTTEDKSTLPISHKADLTCFID